MLRRVHIHETEVGLLYRRGRYQGLLEPGGHWLLGPGLRVDRVDVRRRLSVVGSQEVLTSDSVQLRCSAVVGFRVVDPARALHESTSSTSPCSSRSARSSGSPRPRSCSSSAWIVAGG